MPKHTPAPARARVRSIASYPPELGASRFTRPQPFCVFPSPPSSHSESRGKVDSEERGSAITCRQVEERKTQAFRV
jgi:hypothetical protein